MEPELDDEDDVEAMFGFKSPIPQPAAANP